MPRFIFKINKYNDKRKIIDSVEEWITARECVFKNIDKWKEKKTKTIISKAFPSSKNYECFLIKTEDV